MKRALALVLLLTGAVYAEEPKAPDPLQEPATGPPIHWTVEVIEGDSVPADGRHIGLAWTRDRDPGSTVVVFRRVAAVGDTSKGGAIHVVDQLAQIVPSFMYPDTYKTEYYKAVNAATKPIPRGTELGIWTVAGAVDGDPKLWIDEVPPGAKYIYALVPATRGSAPDTYTSLVGSAVATPAIAPSAATTLWHKRWVQVLIGLAVLAVIAGAIALVMRRRRAGARPSGEASSTP
jgi:glyoxylase-like metal-dependent hydrolase (beta-lactamase superfamily II)